LANQFRRGDSVRFKTVGAGVTNARRGTVAKTVRTARGVRVEVIDASGQAFRPHQSMVKLSK
jgi:hypothetical protein